jgi:hypothetical protein
MKQAVCLALLCAACSSSSDAGDDEPADASVYFEDAGPYPAIREKHIAQALSEAQDARDARCCQSAGLVLNGKTAAVLPDPDAKAAFNAEAAAACVAETRRQDCLLYKDPPAVISACQRAFGPGNRKKGQPCLTQWDCAAAEGEGASASCGTSPTLGQVCFVERDVQRGESCAPSGTALELVRCVWPLQCDAKTEKCVDPPGVGEACTAGASFGDTCGAGAVCDASDTKKCVQPRAEGASCKLNDECEAFACIGGVCRKPLSVLPYCALPK